MRPPHGALNLPVRPARAPTHAHGSVHRYEAILLQRASGASTEAIDALWTATRPIVLDHASSYAHVALLHGSGAPAAHTAAAAAAVSIVDASGAGGEEVLTSAPQLVRAKMCLKLAGWLSERPFPTEGSAVHRCMMDEAAAASAALVTPANATSPSISDELSAMSDAACGRLLSAATAEAPSHAKAHLRWGSWCYRQGSSVLRSLAASGTGGGTDGVIELTSDEHRKLLTLVAEAFPPALANDRRVVEVRPA